MPRTKRARSPSPPLEPVNGPPESPHKSKKLKLLAAHATSSPFPAFARPSPAEAHRVHALLAAQLGPPALRAPTAASNAAETCGSVPDVIEALIGTVLSQNTSAHNSAGAKRSLDAAFGRDGFAAIAAAPRADVVAAIRCGGLANKKAATIQRLLQAVQRKHGVYSLQHLAAPGVSDEDAMAELVAYDGIGPKTASCVLMFCLGRASFAVDTHVFRLSRLLGWVPAHADRVRAQAHLDLRIPGALKYGLHVGMVAHGRACRGCAPAGRGECVLRAYLRHREAEADLFVSV